MKDKVRIIYKSGAVLDLKVAKGGKFSVTRDGTCEITEIVHEGVTPRPLFIGINEIAAVWEL